MTELTGRRGAIYFPSRAFNGYQTWADYDRHRTHHDLSLARSLNLNSLRVLASYEYWREDREAFQRRFDHFLEIADVLGLSVLPVLFEAIGDPPTQANLTDTDIDSAFAVCSPHRDVIRSPLGWTGPASFVRWFVRRYGDHPAVVAVEIMNEPGGWGPRVSFCRAMLRAARRTDVDVPLTMGCIDLAANRRYQLDVYQFHYNIPPTADHMRRKLREAARFGRRHGKPVWLTEWQRTREEPPDKMRPHYASLAATIRDGPIDGDFLWGLMLKPAYMRKPRQQGRLNGVFHEDGTPYTRTDAAAIAGSDGFGPDRPSWPAWARPDPRTAAPVSDGPGRPAGVLGLVGRLLDALL